MITILMERLRKERLMVLLHYREFEAEGTHGMA